MAGTRLKVTDQLIRLRNRILDLLGIGYHERRAVNPSRWEPCEGSSFRCSGAALVGEGQPKPWLCGYCAAEEKR